MSLNLVIAEMISALLQVIAFSLIPLIFYFFQKHRDISFHYYIGLYWPTWKSVKYSIGTSLLFVAAGIVMIFLDDGVREIVTQPPSVTGKIRTIDSPGTSIALICIIAMIKTSLAEEIFFRGFIAKRLMALWGFGTGNFIQSTLFGLVHLALFWKLMHPTLFALSFIFILSTLAGWVIGLIKFKYANGSIVPGWIAHALGNATSYAIIVFSI